MREKVQLFLFFVLLVFSPKLLFGQHELVIDDFTVTGHYLNDDILGDSTSTGARNDPDRVYVLKRGGTYLVNDQIRNTDWVLRVKAEAGTGAKPIIYSFKNSLTAAYPAQIFDVQGDLWLSNLDLVGWAEFLPAEISDMPSRIINVSSAGPSVYVDSCIISASRAATIQTSSAAHVLKVTNTTMAQGGNLFNTNIGNGRHIDLRNVSCDSVIIQNCSMTDNTDRIIRHYSSVGDIGYFRFDHNTVVNEMAMHGCLGLGYVGAKVEITNNLFVDNFVLGNDSTDDVRLGEFGDPAELDQFGNNRMTFVGTVPRDSVSTQFVIRNNYYSVSDSLQAWYDTHADIGLGNLIPLTWYINSQLGADSVNAFTKESVVLNKPTHTLVKFAEWYWTPDPNGPGKSKNTTNFSTDIDYQRPTIDFYSNTASFDLAYSQTTGAFTGADNGLPAGDLRWWTGVVGVEDDEILPNAFSLEQNYPNPFNPSTKIVYNIPKESIVTLEVFNILGQHVATLVNENQTLGVHSINFNASNLSSGVYIYQLSSENQLLTRKMMLLK